MTRTAIPAEAFDHGDPRRYRRGCRCDDCKAGINAENKRNRYHRSTGRRRLIPVQQAASHLLGLRAAGMSDAEILTAARICPDQLYRILRGDGRIAVDTERNILAVTVPAGNGQGNYSVTDGTGTRRRLRALVAAGWPATELGFRLGVFKQQVGYLLRAGGTGQVTLRVEAEVRRVYLDLWNEKPEAHGVAGHIALRARRLAARRGWHPAAVWDDIDNPDEQPNYGEHTPRPVAIVEDTAELVALGLSRDAIAERLGITWDAVQKAHSRMSTPLPELAA
jgi:uncharacterized protein (DUF433 family)